MTQTELQKDKTRFEFGQNWQNFSRDISENTIDLAVAGMKRLLPVGFDPRSKSLLDIGSGSGVHSIAATRLGFSPVVATDYDTNSVAATSENARRFGAAVSASRDDILNSRINEQFDVVYSWGVLHHTGDMKGAISAAASKVKPGGLFIIAIYYRTPFCGMWTTIKKTYCRSPAWVQKAMVNSYYSLVTAKRRLNGKGLADYNDRGMDRYHDVIDWMGGYPYQSANAEEVKTMVGPEFTQVIALGTQERMGLFGTACAEYTFRRA